MSVPALFWLWRLSATHRQIRVPSLVPFEHLVKRQARRKTRLIVNLLFWLQLAALCGLTLALAQPVLPQRHVKLIFAVLDTSASMDAHLRGPSAFDRAKQTLRIRLARKAPTAQVFLMTTAPVTSLTSKPTSDLATLTRVIERMQVSHLTGNLSTTMRIGRALLGVDPDETLVVTDEPVPLQPLGNRITWVTVGESLPNVAIVGVDAHGPLCTPADGRVTATIQNFSNETSIVNVTAQQDGRMLAETSSQLQPRARASLSLALSAQTHGWVDITLSTPRDALAVDNHAWAQLNEHARLPIVIQSQRASLVQAISTWLGACPAVTWTTEAPSRGSFLVISDRGEDMLRSASAALLFLPPSPASPIRSYWVTSADHPIGAYLAPVETVSASLNLVGGEQVAGMPIITGLVQGRKVPLVVADERDGRRLVFMFLDPASCRDSTPMVLAFFNSLRWLMGQSDMSRVGEPLTLGGLGPGTIKVVRPDRSSDMVDAEGGLLRYDATMLAGRYRFMQGTVDVTAAVNFFDPLESNTLDRPSTWRVPLASSGATSGSSRAVYPLTSLLIIILCMLLLIEWGLYCAKRQTTVFGPQSTVTHK